MFPRHLIPALLLCTAPALAITPTFTKITDTTPGTAISTNAYYPGPKVNNNGQVVFGAKTQSNVGGTNAIYLGSLAGGAITPIVDGSGAFSFASNFDIDNTGTVIFSGYPYGDAFGIYARHPNGSFSPIVQKGGAWDVVKEPRVSGNGNIAFSAYKTDGIGGVYRTTTAGGPVTPISEDFGPLHQYYPPSVNNAGTVAFRALDDANNWLGIYSGSGGPVTTVATNSFNTFASSEINNAGQIGINGTFSISRWDGFAWTTLAETFPGAYNGFSDFSVVDTFGAPGIADTGLMAFGARTRSTLTPGIFIGPDAVNDKIIADGDPLFGSTLKYFAFDRGISDDGRYIAFAYELTNGASGIAVATIPEPSAAAILLLLPALSRFRRRQPPHTVLSGSHSDHLRNHLMPHPPAARIPLPLHRINP
ncbi:MAG TPA: choice-of-anchor tandem repeat NxxGxxAF-containing protein [Tepidisphaeraceae bacterium]